MKTFTEDFSEKISYVELLAATSVFSLLSPVILKSIARTLVAKSLEVGDVLMRENEIGNSLYIILEGRLEASVGGIAVGEIVRGEPAGEAALLTDEPRAATVTALTPCRILEFTRENYKNLLDSHKEQISKIADFITKRRRLAAGRRFRPASEDLVELLSETDYFKKLPVKLLREIESLMQWQYLPDNEILMNQGDRGDSMYVVLNGRLMYYSKNEEGEVISKGFLGRGDIIGEVSLLTGEKRMASVVAYRESEVIRFSNTSLKRYMLRFPKLAPSIARVVAQRLHQSLSKHKENPPPKNIALIPIHKNISTHQFSQALKSSIQGRVLLLDEKGLLESHGFNFSDSEDNGVSIRFRHWLSGMEKDYDTILLVGSTHASPWTEQAFRQADRLLLLADATGSGRMSEVEIKFLGDSKDSLLLEKELILIHNDNKEIQAGKTNEFLQFRKMKHSHLRKNNQEDFFRLGRSLANRSIALVLGGGGAKSFAQIGVIKSLNEHKIPFDAVGGTSMGSLIAGLASMGMDADDIKNICNEYIVKNNPMMDFTFPFISMIRAKKYSNRLRSFFKNIQIEDLRIPYFAVATNLTRSSLEVLDGGPLWEAVRASTSLPGYVPPFYRNGDLLVDGGLMNNVPAVIMRSRGYSRIISVDVAKTDNHESDSYYGELLSEKTPGSSPSFFKIMISLFRKKSLVAKCPTIGNILMRSSLIASRNARENAKKASNIYINLPTESYSLLNFKPIGELIDIGYNYANENIAEWKRQLSL